MWHHPVDQLLEIIAPWVINIYFLGSICSLLAVDNTGALALYT